MDMKIVNKHPGVKLILVLKPGIAIGPGNTGSISAAGRAIIFRG